MRKHQNEEEFSTWLLQLGNGELFSTWNDVPVDSVDIPVECCCNNSLVKDFFNRCTNEEMEHRLILRPTHTDCLASDEEVLNMLPSELKTYFSID